MLSIRNIAMLFLAISYFILPMGQHLLQYIFIHIIALISTEQWPSVAGIDYFEF